MSKDTLFVDDLAVAIALAKQLASKLQYNVTVLHSEQGYFLVRTTSWIFCDGNIEKIETYNYITTVDPEDSKNLARHLVQEGK